MNNKVQTLPPSIVDGPNVITSQFADGSVMRVYHLKGQPPHTFTMDIVNPAGEITRVYEMVDTKAGQS